jgi:hypothetical protein
VSRDFFRQLLQLRRICLDFGTAICCQCTKNKQNRAGEAKFHAGRPKLALQALTPVYATCSIIRQLRLEGLNARQVHASEKSFYFDDCVHPGMDTALEIVSSLAESFYLYTVTMMDHRRDIRTALGKGR